MPEFEGDFFSSVHNDISRNLLIIVTKKLLLIQLDISIFSQSVLVKYFCQQQREKIIAYVKERAGFLDLFQNAVGCVRDGNAMFIHCHSEETVRDFVRENEDDLGKLKDWMYYMKPFRVQ